MASSSKQVLLLAVVVAALTCLASLASATQWVVGDDCGWKPKFNQTGWENGKTFVVGDTLLFKYPKKKHTVVQVSEEDFDACNVQGNQAGARDCGHDVVQLDRPGRMWFICTKGDHCRDGMKLAIDVVDGGIPGPDPSLPPLPFPFPGVPPPPPPPFTWGSAPPPPSSFAAPPPPSAAVRNMVGGAVAAAAAAAALVTAALAF